MRSAISAATTRNRAVKRAAAAATAALALRPGAHPLSTHRSRFIAAAAQMSSAAAAPNTAHSAAQVAPVASPASACVSSLASAALATDYSDPSVRHLAVYGTLRDDDDSGASWTADFLRGLTSARAGTVRGARMYWSAQGSWPFAMVHEHSSARSADPAAASLCEHESDQLHVRLLQFESGPGSFAAKIAAADLIEGFDPTRPNSHEYVRRKVWVEVEDESAVGAAAGAAATASASSFASATPAYPQPQQQHPPKRARVPAWIYIKEHGLTSEVLAGHERMEHGDWMKRERNRN